MSLCKTCLYGDRARVSPMQFSKKEVCQSCVYLDDEQTKASNWMPILQTNADRIRAMSDEELAKYIHAVSLGWQDWCDYHCENKGDDGCDNCILALLKQPAKDGEDE